MSRAPQFVAALDVGKRQDFSALAILHYRCLAAGFDPVYWRTRYDWDLHLRRLTRFPLGTSYRDLPGLVASELRSARLPADSPLLIDATGVGEALVDHLSCGLPVIPVILTPGDRVSRRRGRLRVPKPHLVRTLASLLEDGKPPSPPAFPSPPSCAANSKPLNSASAPPAISPRAPSPPARTTTSSSLSLSPPGTPATSGPTPLLPSPAAPPSPSDPLPPCESPFEPRQLPSRKPQRAGPSRFSKRTGYLSHRPRARSA